MKLYYAPGTISLMPHVALLQSGLSFVAVRVDEASKKMADGEDYNTINPLGYVPALVLDDDSVLLEAAAIAQYIADRDPTGKLAPPHGTIERARLQAWLNFLQRDPQGRSWPAVLHGTGRASEGCFPRAIEGALRLCRSAPVYAPVSVGQGLLHCRRRLVCDDRWTPRVGFDLHAYPNLVAHHARIANRDAVREVHRIEGPIPARPLDDEMRILSRPDPGRKLARIPGVVNHNSSVANRSWRTASRHSNDRSMPTSCTVSTVNRNSGATSCRSNRANRSSRTASRRSNRRSMPTSCIVGAVNRSAGATSCDLSAANRERIHCRHRPRSWPRTARR